MLYLCIHNQIIADMEYKQRIADQMLAKKLACKGAVLIEDPKWCGKTTTAEQHAKSILYMDNPASLESNLVHHKFGVMM